MDEFRKNVLQGEILMLLHDIGKLHWRFVSAATDSEGEEKPNLNALHTQAFLAALTDEEVQNLTRNVTIQNPPWV